jgi:phage recombination protein Bet
MPDDSREIAHFSAPRIAYHPAIQERFGVDLAGWRALIDAVWPAAKTADAVVLALSYCKARQLDPFKRPVHIVPVWSEEQARMVEGVWPGIGELRTTAFRTGLYAGRDPTEYGPEITRKLGDMEITFPEWAQTTVYRIARNGDAKPYPGPRVYWLETYATAKRNVLTPNRMWARRPHGQLDKCSEAAALRAAFPEEIGDQSTNDEMAGQVIDHAPAPIAPPRPRREDFRPEQTFEDAAEAAASEKADPSDPSDLEEPRTWTVTFPDGELREYDTLADAEESLAALLNAQTSRGAIEAIWEDNRDLVAGFPRQKAFEQFVRDLLDRLSLAAKPAGRMVTGQALNSARTPEPPPQAPAAAPDPPSSPESAGPPKITKIPVPIRKDGTKDYRAWALISFWNAARKASADDLPWLVGAHEEEIAAYKASYPVEFERFEKQLKGLFGQSNG